MMMLASLHNRWTVVDKLHLIKKIGDWSMKDKAFIITREQVRTKPSCFGKEPWHAKPCKAQCRQCLSEMLTVCSHCVLCFCFGANAIRLFLFCLIVFFFTLSWIDWIVLNTSPWVSAAVAVFFEVTCPTCSPIHVYTIESSVLIFVSRMALMKLIYTLTNGFICVCLWVSMTYFSAVSEYD